ncbi:MAG: GcrA family cell cycle regulator [Pseudomonadota bacterium]
MSWTDERVEALKTMWGEGKSASQIAKELGGVTRNAVIGKVHRLGLSNRATGAGTKAQPAEKESTSAKAEAPRAAAKPAAPAEEVADATPAAAAQPAEARGAAQQQPLRPNPKPVALPGQPLPPQPSQSEISAEQLASMKAVEKTSRRLSLMQLTERTCKWPVGDPATDDFWFCGHPCQPGKPYCETHVAVAFQPMSSRRDRRASSR